MAAAAIQHARYKYQSLDDTKQQIRLLSIERNTSTSTPSCNVHVFDLATAPPYVALSYMWGPPSPTYCIRVDDTPFEIRKNLHDFLCTFQAGAAIETDTSYIFIDQICINQEDVEEKSCQVRLMSEIYSLASFVIAWLGNDQEMVNAAQRFLENSKTSIEDPSTAPTSIQVILSNPYFKRVWIVQELCLSKELRVLVGEIELPELDLIEGRKLCKPGQCPVSVVYIFGGLRWDDKGTKRRQYDLLRCTRMFGDHGCQDPRDKIYGFLGMIPKEQRPVVDYNKSTHQVLLDTLRVILEMYWENLQCKPIEDIHVFRRIYRHLASLETLVEEMGFENHDIYGFMAMLHWISHFLVELAQDFNGFSPSQLINDFGYERIESHALETCKDAMVGRWWLEVNKGRDYFDCIIGMEPTKSIYDLAQDGWYDTPGTDSNSNPAIPVDYGGEALEGMVYYAAQEMAMQWGLPAYRWEL